MTFKVLKKEYVEVDVPQADVVKGTVAILTRQLKQNNKNLYKFDCFFEENDRYFGLYELVTSHRSDEKEDVTNLLSQEDKDLLKIVFYLEHPPFKLSHV